MDATREVHNVADLLRAAAATRPDHPALVGPAGTRTWVQLDAEVDGLVGRLRAADLRLGDRVALLFADAAAFVPAYLAVLRAGLVAVPVDHHGPAPEVGRALIETGARVLLVDDRCADAAEAGAALSAAAGVPAAVVRVAAVDPSPTAESAAGGASIAVLLETAGTGGRPKRAMLSHRALLANVAQCAALDPAPVGPDDVVLLALPLSGVFGLNAVLGQALNAGATLALAADPDPAATLALIATAGVTSIAATPAMFAAWAARPEAREALAGVRVLISGSAPLRAEAAAAFAAVTGKTLGQGYGLTEAAGVVAAAPAGRKAGTVGGALPGIDVRLLDLAGNPAAEGDPGELWLRGENLFAGYWPDGHGAPGSDGWFATGDLGWTDAAGDLFMVSTRSDVIVVSGFPVYPGEVEDVVVAHPEVREAAVVGVADPASGAAVKALVVLAAGAGTDAEGIRVWCAARLGRFKVPRQVEFVAELPRSAAGGIARGRLRGSES